MDAIFILESSSITIAMNYYASEMLQIVIVPCNEIKLKNEQKFLLSSDGSSLMGKTMFGIRSFKAKN